MKFIQKKDWILIFLGVLPALFFAWTLFHNASNTPWLDDFEVAPMTLFNWIHEPNWSNRWALLWSPNNEHRVVMLKALIVLNYYLFGQLSIKWIIWQTHLYLIPLYLLIWKSLPKENRLTVFIPSLFLFLNFQYFLSSYWMIASAQHNLVIGFGGISMFLLTRPTKSNFIGALFFALLACISNSDGMFFIIIGSLVLFLQHRMRELYVWASVFALMLFLIFWSYPSMGYHERGLSYFFQHPLASVQGFFVFMGGGFDFWYRELSQFRLLQTGLIGFCLMFVIAVASYYFLFQSARKEQLNKWRSGDFVNPNILFISAMLGFCLMNALVISILRSSWGEFVYLIGNYKIYPTLAMLFIYLLALHVWKFVGVYRYFFIGFSFIFWSISILNSFEDVTKRKESLTSEYQKLMNGKGGLGFTDEQQAKFGVVKAMKYFESKHMYHAD